MTKVYEHGKKPFRAVALHGGPGACGQMAPVAAKMSEWMGTLEPHHKAKSVAGQVGELKEVLKRYETERWQLVGHSWGAWLAFMFAAEHQPMVEKIVLVGSGPFLERYRERIQKKRLARLGPQERRRVDSLEKKLKRGEAAQEALQEFGRLMTKADAFRLVEDSETTVDLDYETYAAVWAQASRLRSSGELLDLGNRIDCPVVALHGDYDPHPWQGVKEPLQATVSDFKFYLIKNCGHLPWREERAKEEFFHLLRRETASLK